MSSLVGKVVGYVGEHTDEDGKEWTDVIYRMPKNRKRGEWDWNPEEERVSIQHDYVRFQGAIGIQMERDEDGNYPIKDIAGASNWVSTRGSVTIGIRDMYQIVLPMLNKAKELQPGHFALRGPLDRDTDKEKYHPYCYGATIIHHRDEDTGVEMVTFRRVGEHVDETVTLSLFNTIKGTLKLSLSKKDLESDRFKK